jgi:predicted adenine nucleotide alpha hydrolase (AANH) superfamily ATPase
MIHEPSCRCPKCVSIVETSDWKVAHRHGDIQVTTKKDLSPSAATALLSALAKSINEANYWRQTQSQVAVSLLSGVN